MEICEMGKLVKSFRLLLSCPSDLQEIKLKLLEKINNFNKSYGERNGISINLVNWKDDAYPQMGKSPQKILNDQFVSSSDMVVAMFWTRFGTKTDNYESGTEEEIEIMLKSGKQVFLYFLDCPIRPSKIDINQYKNVLRIKERYKDKGIYFDFESEEDLIENFCHHLEKHFENIGNVSKLKEIGSKKSILWVDDHPENNIIEIDYLRELGIDVDCTFNTTSAERLLRTNEYSLIISDMGRREGDKEGYKLLESKDYYDNKIPFIIFSSDGSKEEYRLEAKERGATDSVDSSIDLVQLVIKTLI